MKLYCTRRQESGSLLEQIFGIKGEEVGKNQWGKPYLKDHKMYFNVSHTGNYTFLAAADQEVGIDAEEITSYDERIPALYFTGDERDYWYRSRDRRKAFFEIWTKKESCLKYLGMGFFLTPQSISVMKQDICRFRSITINGRIQIAICCREAFSRHQFLGLLKNCCCISAESEEKDEIFAADLCTEEHFCKGDYLSGDGH